MARGLKEYDEHHNNIVTLREEDQQHQRDPRDKQDEGPCNLRVMVADDVW